MTNKELLDCLIDRPCAVCKFHEEKGCTKWDCVFDRREQEPKTGHWIEDNMTYCGVELANYKCDKCGEMGGTWRKGLKPDKLPKYCPNCGAKMESEG